ncbi:MAG: winged helix-turn-helix domain-containing protein [Ignavibacteriales bacterium]|nr:winged helix-turn-helix domain-containing protein [Ignavibacteriales bacterium]
MLDSIITSKTRVKLLLKFFLNPETKAYLRGLSDEFGESSNGVRLELNRLTKAGLLTSESDGNKKVYRANVKNALFPEINKIIKKDFGIDIIENVLHNLGNVELAFVTGDYAKGIDGGVIDLVIVGEVNKVYMNELIEVTEKTIKRKIRALVLNKVEYKKLKDGLKIDKALVVWNNEPKKDD